MTPSKRMRLGTKSCTECRRRKVRCIFRADESACEACLAHEANCIAQQSGCPEVSSDEAIVRKLPPSPRSDFAGDDASVVRERDARTDLSSITTLTHSSAMTPSIVGELPLLAANNGGVMLSSTDLAVEESPLMLLVEAASILDSENAPESAASGVLQYRDHFASLLPSMQDLDAILEDTERYWPIWPPYYFGELGLTDDLGPGKRQMVRQLICAVAASSVNPGLIARSTLWVALCVQQISRSLLSIVSLAYPQYDLVDAYIRIATSLLELDRERGGSIDGIESMNMLYKLSINTGRSQTAWYWCRQAITTAVGLGLPRKVDALDIRSTSDRRAANAWSMAWQTERFMALMLGLPTSVSAKQPETSSNSSSTPLISRIMCSVALICGKAIDRNHAHQMADSYATTVVIDRDMEEICRLFLDEQWLPLAPDMSLSVCWNQQVSKAIFFTTLKLVHMPYMLKLARESKFRHSWDRAMEAARGAATAYAEFRTWPGAGTVLCELIDFQAFSAAIVLIIGHMISPTRATPLAKEKDWALVRDVSLCLRRTVAMMDCVVAAQAAHVLGLVDAACHGAYIADDDYIVAIPYLGRIRINKNKVSVDNQNDSESSLASSCLGLIPMLPVEFGVGVLGGKDRGRSSLGRGATAYQRL
ncbi:putative transcription factor gsfR1 [Penicillium rolfsii]|nr:putative transcription factor gsfR1 [Penicillium rolfsii]